MNSERRSRHVSLGLAGVSVLVAVLAFSMPANAITWGEPDSGHPYAGAIIVEWQGAWYQYCSGSLVSPRVFLTASHCTINLGTGSFPLDKVRVTFSQHIWAADAIWLEVVKVYTHPEYGGPWSDPHDIGAFVLKDPVRAIVLGRLPSESFLDSLAAGGQLKDATFINVGYGADQSMPPNRKSMPGPDARWSSVSGFRSLHKAWLHMSGNPHLGYGGTCYGDSGGPTLYRDRAKIETIVALTVWGDAPCKSTNNNYRVDTASSLAFVSEIINHNG